VDNDNVKWFAAGTKLVSFDGKVWRTYSSQDGLPADGMIGGMVVDHNGIFWLINGGMLISFNGIKFTQYKTDGFYIASLAIDKDNSVWIGTMKGLARFDGSTFSYISATQMTSGPSAFRNLIIDEDGNKWCTTWFAYTGIRELVRYDGSSWKVYTVDDRLISNDLMAAGVDPENRKWFGTLNWGISCFDGEKWTRMTLEKPYVNANPILFDHGGVMWLGLGTFGAMSVCGDERVLYKVGETFTDGVISIAVGKDNKKWFSTGSGLTSFDGNEWRSYTLRDSLSIPYHFSAIAVDQDNVVWAGSPFNLGLPGLFRFDGKVWESVLPKEGLPNININSIIVDKENVKWFLIDNGVSSFDGVIWRYYSEKEFFSGNEVLALAADLNNVKWFATDKGIMGFDGSTWKTYLPEKDLPIDRVNIILVDRENVKWFMKSYFGIISFDDRTETFVEESKLPLSFSLNNYPNPFNPSTTIEYVIPHDSEICMTIYSVTGQKIRTLFSGKAPAGKQVRRWDGKNDRGDPVSSGVYLVEIRAGRMRAVHTMMLLR
jgi:ligand-binding sensor domain-containing protein